MARLWNEKEPEGIQKNFITSLHLKLRQEAERQYNPIFTKTAQGGAQKLPDTNAQPYLQLTSAFRCGFL